jgi:hypothetical protein
LGWEEEAQKVLSHISKVGSFELRALSKTSFKEALNSLFGASSTDLVGNFLNVYQHLVHDQDYTKSTFELLFIQLSWYDANL